MRNSTRGLLLAASLVLAGSAFAAPAGGIVEHPPVQQGYGTGPYGGYVRRCTKCGKIERKE